MWIKKNGVDMDERDKGWERWGFNNGLRIKDGDGNKGRGKEEREKISNGVMKIIGGKMWECLDKVGEKIDNMRKMRSREGKRRIVMKLDIVEKGKKREKEGKEENNKENDDECREEEEKDGLYEDEFDIRRKREKDEMERKNEFNIFKEGLEMSKRRREIRVGDRNI